MEFRTHPLQAPLDQHIESIFHYKNFTPDHSIERVVPTGHIFLIFELDNIPRNTFHNDTLKPKETYIKVWISGMHKNYISISAHQNSEMFVVQFKSSGTFPFFHLPGSELNDKVVAAEEILGEDILILREEIFEASSVERKFQFMQNWLEERYEEKNAPPEELMKVLKSMKNDPVNEFQKIVEAYPYTQKHLIDQFKKYVGLTPKYFHRILRFNEIFQEIKNNQKIAWSSIAYRCGYADQSHFIKEFKHFSGFNPQEFIKQDFGHDEANFFPLNRTG